MDVDSDVSEISFTGSIEELKHRLKVLSGEKPDAVIVESERDKIEKETTKKLRKKNVATEGGRHLLSKIFAEVKN